MSEDSGVLEILDLKLDGDELTATRQRVMSAPGERLEVALPSRRPPDGFTASRNGALYYRQAPGVSSVNRVIGLEVSGDPSSGTRYRWSEVASSGAQLAVVVLPRDHTLVRAEPTPVSARVFDNCLVVFWTPDQRAIAFELAPLEGNLHAAAKRLNRDSPTGGNLPDLKKIAIVQPRPRIGSLALAIFAVLLGVAAGLYILISGPDRRVTGPAVEEETKDWEFTDCYEVSYALVVGINRYPSSRWSDLAYATKDARAIAEFLKTRGFRVKTLFDAGATKKAILRYVEDELAPRLEKDDRVLFFFAGHGHTRELGGVARGYIVPYDAEDDSATYISLDKLRELSGKMGTAKHQLYILDACFGGLMGFRAGSFDPKQSDYLSAVMRRPARQVLTAGGKDEQVVDGYGPGGHSVFTGYLLEALERGLADSNGDGYVTFSELASYVLPRATTDYQTPGYATLQGHGLGEFVFRVNALEEGLKDAAP